MPRSPDMRRLHQPSHRVGEVDKRPRRLLTAAAAAIVITVVAVVAVETLLCILEVARTELAFAALATALACALAALRTAAASSSQSLLASGRLRLGTLPCRNEPRVRRPERGRRGGRARDEQSASLVEAAAECNTAWQGSPRGVVALMYGEVVADDEALRGDCSLQQLKPRVSDVAVGQVEGFEPNALCAWLGR